VAPDSPPAGAGIRPGDLLLTINDSAVPNAAHVARACTGAFGRNPPLQTQRNGEEFETRLITIPRMSRLPSRTTCGYARLFIIHLFIGLFIFIRRWNAPRAVHFYVFCLVSFILYVSSTAENWTPSIWKSIWTSVAARLLAPALLLHFALVFGTHGVRPASHF